jgi:enamine deaminase RidA (YjgF/YER057c/UK114 family)
MSPHLPTRRGFFGGATAATLGVLLPRRVSALVGLDPGGPEAPQVSPEARLRELGIELPTPRAPIATFVTAVTVGDMLYVAGHTPRMPDGSPGVRGKVGRELTLEEGRDQARLVGLLVLATMRAHLGSLDRVARLVRTFGMVNATPDFDQQPQVINGFSDLMVDVFGEELGKGTRAAVGMGSLPGGMSVEVESFWQIRS